MSLAETGTAVYEKGIESCLARLVGDAETCRPAETVAFTFDEVLESIGRIEVRVDTDLLETRDQVGIAVVFQ